MIVTHKLTMDLTRREKLPCIDVMQDDKYSRDLQIRVKSNGIRCRLPEDCSVLIRYEKPDETKGFYDTMPDGSRAWSVGEAELTVRLAPQVCTVPGKVKLMVTLLRAEAELNFFEMELNVHKRCGALCPPAGDSNARSIPAGAGYGQERQDHGGRDGRSSHRRTGRRKNGL